MRNRWGDRVAASDWDSIRAELGGYGCALTGPLLTRDDAAAVAALYSVDSRFRSTIHMARYRYFAEPFPEACVRLEAGPVSALVADRAGLVDKTRPGQSVAGQPGRVAADVPRRFC